jgi:hypothetical protein
VLRSAQKAWSFQTCPAPPMDAFRR